MITDNIELNNLMAKYYFNVLGKKNQDIKRHPHENGDLLHFFNNNSTDFDERYLWDLQIFV